MRPISIALIAVTALLAIGVVRSHSLLLVNARSDADLGKFAVVDMADALGRVAGPARTSDAPN